MSPMSLLTLSPEDLQAAHARDEGLQNSPHGERRERSCADWMGVALLMMAAAVMMLMLR